MKIIFCISFFVTLSWLQGQENKITLTQLDINKDKEIKLFILNQQVVFSRPDQKILIDGFNKSSEIKITKDNIKYDFTFDKNIISLKTPNENETLTFEALEPKIKFFIVAGIKDIDTKDGFLSFNGQKYSIGYYPPIPNSGKVKFFKEKYVPPNYFFIWNTNFEQNSISINLKYQDLVIKPDAEEPGKERPERPTKIFTLSYETILNFEKIITEAKSKVKFNKIEVLSFYRTPEYNKKIGGSEYSRHIYGDGIDWFIDENPFDEIMDDLNNDEKVTADDAKPFVESIITLVSNKTILPCGTGVYFTKKGASLHYDSRGHLARWGESDKWWPEKDLPDWLKEIENKVKENDLQKK